MQDKLVSVIVPVYNVEKYLERCVNSIVSQTYSCLEIILVDDGATDMSGDICDMLALRDKRIRVIHKMNGGLSDARNAGMDVMTGEYVLFVDSDDYIDVDTIELLINNLEKFKADISCCRFRWIYEKGKPQDIGNDHTVKVFCGEECLREYLQGFTLDPFACGKLYKKECVEKHRFIVGIIGEDNPFNFDVFKECKCVVISGESKYNYLQKRDGAITNSSVSKGKIDSVLYWDTVRQICVTNYPSLVKYALRRQILFYVGLYNMTYSDIKYSDIAKDMRSFVKDHLTEIMQSDICEKRVKISCFLLAKTPRFYNIIMKIYKKAVGVTKL